VVVHVEGEVFDDDSNLLGAESTLKSPNRFETLCAEGTLEIDKGYHRYGGSSTTNAQIFDINR
jgi:hypothetical protein